MTTLLVTPEEIKRETVLGGNVDNDKFIFMIRDQQELFIEPILGTALYKKLQQLIAAGTLTTGIYFDLWEKCKPIVKFLVLSDLVESSNLNVMNGGVFKNQPDNAQIVEQNEAYVLAKSQRIKADAYKNRLEKFLCDKSQELPEYKNPQENDYDERPHKNDSLVGGWHLNVVPKNTVLAQYGIPREDVD